MSAPETALELSRHRLVTRAHQWGELHPEELRRRAVEAARDKAAESLWSLTEAHRTAYGAAGAKVSAHTLRMYREAVRSFARYAEEHAVGLLDPSRNAGALYLRFLEGEDLAPATVRVKLAGARALYKALRWAGATNADPFADVRAAPEVTPAWDKRAPYSEEEAARLLGHASIETTRVYAKWSDERLRDALNDW